jgi:phenylalanyl-tRNA synthetase beta chain
MEKLKKQENEEEQQNKINLVTNLKENLDSKNIKYSDEVLYKIEVPSNRFDLICLEGLAISLKAFLGITPMPKYSLKPSGEKVIIKKSTEKIRPFIVCAILRNIKFNEDSLKRFLDLQDKLHGTICK